MPHTTTVKVRFYELDPYNHLNHSVYVQYFEVARINLLESIGFGLDQMEANGYRIVVTELDIKYITSAGPRDQLIIETDVAEVRRASSRWRQQMLRGDVVIATQEISAASVDLDGRVMRFPPELADALEPYLQPEA